MGILYFPLDTFYFILFVVVPTDQKNKTKVVSFIFVLCKIKRAVSILFLNVQSKSSVGKPSQFCNKCHLWVLFMYSPPLTFFIKMAPTSGGGSSS